MVVTTRWMGAALLILLGGIVLPVTASAVGPAGCGTGSWIAGTVDICGGELVYRDYVYDDYGARGTPPTPPSTVSTGSLSNPTGTQSYPDPATNGTVNNYADIVAVRLRIDEGAQVLKVSFELNSLFDANPNQTVVALAIDSDNNAATGGGNWSNLIAFPDLSRPLTSSGWDGEVHLFSAGDSATNTIEGEIPLSEIPLTLPVPPGAKWRLQAVAAVASTRVVMNVAFRGTGEAGNWFEDQQAAALQSGNISGFGHTVEVAKLTGGVTEPAVVGPGYYERVYTSDYTIALDTGNQIVYDTGAEGVNYPGIPGRGVSDSGAFAQGFHFVGRNQPYGIFVPSQSAPNGTYGMQLVMHGYSANHTSLIDSALPLQGMRARVGQALKRILVVPLGRGPEGFYSDISERDVLDVMADVEANYPIDLERVFSGGYSMGGYGTLRMATLYPDRFAGYLDWVGYPGDGCGQPDVQDCSAGEVGIPAEWLRNLREVDGAMLYCGADELVNSAQGLWLRGLMAGLHYPHIFYYHPHGEHFTLALADDWMKEAEYSRDLVRRQRPPRITYRTEPWTDAPELGIRHDRAYWISEIRGVLTEERDYVDIDIKTFGCEGAEERTFVEDLPGAGPDPVAWESQSFSESSRVTIEQQNRIEATPGPSGEGGGLANVASFRVDGSSGGACIDPFAPLDYVVTTDGPTEITISDGRVISLPGAGIHEGTLPEPSSTFGLGASAALLAGLSRLRRRATPLT